LTDSSGSQSPGWYYAQGDPVGTQRYWDGSQWVGGPQAVAGAPAPGYGSLAPSYGAPVVGAGAPASYGSRVVAVLIDGAIGAVGIIVVLLLAVLLTALNDTLGVLVLLAGLLGIFGFNIWNLILRQGQTGQSIGKKQQHIVLVADATRGPVGPGMALVRYLLGGLINSFCYIDMLWPLWDPESKRLTDKILNFSVVQA
jgi:uncharacterized RDD family membrane protein YckC